MYGYTNAEGEPMMDGAAYRFEQQLDADSFYDRQADDFYERGWDEEPEPKAVEDCEHGNGNIPEGAGFNCTDCYTDFIGPRMAPESEWDPGSFFTYGE